MIKIFFCHFVLIIFLPVFASVPPKITPQKLVDAAIERTNADVTYDDRYFAIPYPNGDPPSTLGVCTDVIIRSYRAAGNIDLQQLVHEDMLDNFDVYPSYWGLKRPDKNIDHRRVPNLEVFFSRHGESLPITNNAIDYSSGDIVTWNTSTQGNRPHIGIVIDQKTPDGIPLIVDNIGDCPKIQNILFAFKITGHYRYMPI